MASFCSSPVPIEVSALVLCLVVWGYGMASCVKTVTTTSRVNGGSAKAHHLYVGPRHILAPYTRPRASGQC